MAVVGSLNVDRSVAVDRFPMPGETVLGTDLRIDNGGKGANQAVAAARLGADVSMIGAVGDDADGARARQALEAEGIDVSNLATVGTSTGVALITIDGKGENSIVVAPGANATVGSEEVCLADRQIREAEVVLCQFEIPLAAVVAAAKAADGLFVLNPAPAQSSLTELAGMIDVLVPNQGELATISGRDIDGHDDITGAARSLDIPLVVVTLGSEGALVVTPQSASHIPAVEATVVDTTAAGDSFCGALALALANGEDPVRAAEFAANCAAWTVARRGAQVSLPRASDIE